MKKFILPLVVALLTGGLAVADEGAKDEAGSAFRTQAVTRGTLTLTVQARGTLQPDEVIDVGTQVTGRVDKLGPDPDDRTKAVDYGSRVEEGSLLAQLDPSLARVRVDQARAHVTAAEADLKVEEAQLALAEREREKVRKRVGDRVAPEDDLDSAAARCQVAQARVVRARATIAEAQAALKEAEVNLESTAIRSPVKGVIVDRRVNVGQTVGATPNAPSLFLIATDLKRLQVWASVNEADVGSIHPGQAARFTVDAFPNLTFAGTVKQVRLNASMTQNVVTYTVVLDTDNADGKLLPYLTAHLQFRVAEHSDVLLVPNAALRWKPSSPEQVAPDAREDYARSLRRNAYQPREPPAHDRAIVWVPQGKFVRPVNVSIGLSDGAVTEVVKGDLAEGERVVTRQGDPAGGR